ncbi:MAG: FAD-linked oxidase C-terminal domain-containing protein [bacterium]
MSKYSEFEQALRELLPGDAIVSDESGRKAYECDGLNAHRTVPWLVALPDNEQQVQQILKLCHQHQIPVVPRGAGTGLSGGARPLEQGLLLSLAKLNQILTIDPDNNAAVVQPGVRNISISEAAKPHGLYYAPDPSSQIACTIGGNVAENSGGVHCLKYGLTVHNVRKVRMVTMDGELLTIGSDALDSPGFDLLALMNGSEGLLGVITEITVKLTPIPKIARAVLAAFNNVEKAGEAVGAIIAAGIIPAGLEMMDKLSINAAEDFIHAGYPTSAEAILICELDGTESEVEAEMEKLLQVLNAHGCVETRLSRSEQERQQLWAGRKAAFPAIGRISPDYYVMDGTIPRYRLPEVLRAMREMSERHGLRVANVFHAGDGNLHPLILYDANKPGELEKAEAFGGEILSLCVKVGGTITGEHGVGTEKLDQMCVQFNAPELTQFHAIKHAFDPVGLLNPGKAVPTLHRCAELGAMHVHHGELPHPELERF